MSYDIVWEFRPAAERALEFEQAYGPEGAWVRLFRHAPGFIETRLLRDTEEPTRYLTVDRWESRHAFDDFKRRFATEYRTLDVQLEGLARSETRLGAFDTMP
ncbi:antibiotic biosynthesis monooxygenase [Dyella jiangningensis]|jgi:heme-degrading monooxygenase HmoA|uniref:antibiotic biosynthesis monooxygenase family protein n=1 Tax=Dyella jiangningensis TaxID=1379159 RepID=UPI00240F281D|nr:antibiotic biosynthesis monooxygenase family protein [Dyella jiangningensis]MDG2538206.1 antibiotic biosynthesis monooxygenase [Dyella jiangningensis]